MRTEDRSHRFYRCWIPQFASAGLAALTTAVLMTTPVAAQGVVGALAGDWSGSGRINYADGTSEGIRCTAYYSGGGSELRMAIQCKSDKNPIHIRSKLKIDGSRATGDWEERTFNMSGSASGTVSASNMSLAISGGGFTGSMSVPFSKSSHSVNISAQGVAMSRVTISFNRR